MPRISLDTVFLIIVALLVALLVIGIGYLATHPSAHHTAHPAAHHSNKEDDDGMPAWVIPIIVHQMYDDHPTTYSSPSVSDDYAPTSTTVDDDVVTPCCGGGE